MTDQELIQALRGHSSQEWAIPRIAAARLEALLEENERMKAQVPKWRPASEPPEETGAYLVDLRVGKALLCFTVKGMPFVPAGSWYRVDDFGYPEVIRTKEIKCWMPLPSTEGGTV